MVPFSPVMSFQTSPGRMAFNISEYISPYHPSSTGLVERVMKTFKEGMKKASITGKSHVARMLFQHILLQECHLQSYFLVDMYDHI